MGNYILYSHAGSNNHGCEALVRTTVAVLGKVDAVYSGDVHADEKYNLCEIANLRPDKDENPDSYISRLLYSIKYKLLKDDKIYFKKIYKKFIREIDRSHTYISIGGDNYCYHFSEWLEVLNKEINKHHAKTVLWGCSINADELENPSVVKDLERYSLITARESLTYELLLKNLHSPQIEYVPDTAFMLPAIQRPLPKGFIEGKTIGLNISPVIIKNAKDPALILSYFVDLVNHIISSTDYQIALIPHVVIKGNDDRDVLNQIYESCSDKSRLVLIEDADCSVLKGYISKCTLFIGARTHATIAAYSSYVPTLVIGYSIKSLGIAKDLFGTFENYVFPVQNIDDSHALIDAFNWLDNNSLSISEHLYNIMPTYISKINSLSNYLEDL